ncbi:MAG: tRNA (uridine(34)/cytosine(34)/5-carboxymethylaminomethyluridine(34)-2'-O)-methyltransferase TrmL [Flammeovirgaceae bacterium]|nr:tRNA (uridine(34)/cytosine(34)/5-carboxymethylaminomethyluridine(34)-2'-O)-methyltransferase TrmL [Flammeovirgaceae bacterium]|tara:strand:- start:495 stop:947 length:453 start_codon:yes stop_codon:yes gene_type:complete
MALNIVLVEPEIPNNTGNIGRLSLAAGANLHLVKPFGFELNDSRVKRAGLDYWKHISLTIYESIDDFYLKNQNKKMVYFSSHASKEYWNVTYQDDLFLIFGKESKGLPKELIKLNSEKTYKIPLFSEHIRSINLANAVSIVVYEGVKSMK